MEISNCVNKNVAIEKINAVQPKLNAVVTMVDEANNTKEGKLSGVPVALKDNISTNIPLWKCQENMVKKS